MPDAKGRPAGETTKIAKKKPKEAILFDVSTADRATRVAIMRSEQKWQGSDMSGCAACSHYL
jgi:hypothetical protein